MTAGLMKEISIISAASAIHAKPAMPRSQDRRLEAPRAERVDALVARKALATATGSRQRLGLDPWGDVDGRDNGHGGAGRAGVVRSAHRGHRRRGSVLIES